MTNKTELFKEMCQAFLSGSVSSGSISGDESGLNGMRNVYSLLVDKGYISNADLPERIWAYFDEGYGALWHKPEPGQDQSAVEYVRADLVEIRTTVTPTNKLCFCGCGSKKVKTIADTKEHKDIKK